MQLRRSASVSAVSFLPSVFVRDTFSPPLMPATAADLSSLRSILEQRFPDATPVTHRTTGQVASGISQLDRALPSGGFPRGRLSAWAPLGGATAILRAA